MEPSLVEELRPLFSGRKLVLTGGPLAAMTGACRRFGSWGGAPFLLATGMGPGSCPGRTRRSGASWRCGRPMSSPRSGRPCGCCGSCPGRSSPLSTGGTRSGGRWSSARCSTSCRRSPGGGCTGPGGPSGGCWRTRSSSTTSGTSWAWPGRRRRWCRPTRPPCGRRPGGWTGATAPPGRATPARDSTAAPSACAGSGARRTSPRRWRSWPRAATGSG